MEYKINGIDVSPEGNCGIYNSELGGMVTTYGVMDMNAITKAVNRLSIDKATKEVEALQDLAASQMEWKTTPKNGFSPILAVSGPGPKPIEEVRGDIENTRRFCSDILAALQGF